MPHHYQYTAQAMDSGQQLTSSCFADSADAVRLRLKRLGYRAGSVSQIKSQDILGPRKRVTLQDMVGFCRRFSVMYSMIRQAEVRRRFQFSKDRGRG